MYTPRGFGVSELGDIEILPVGDDLHLFHLTLPSHDVVQHAVSQDGLTWTPLPAALRTGDPGAIDDDQIWTMSVTAREEDSGYVMLYTALTMRDDGRVQRVAMATSDDLIRWTKLEDSAAIEADSRWYEHDPATSGTVSWRDPKPVRVGERFVAAICARENRGPRPRRGCVGLMVSHDLESWEVRPPLFAPHRYWDLECPQLFTPGGGSAAPWYLLASIMEDRSLRYWMADAPEGPFHVPPSGDLLGPPGHYAGRIARWRGQDLLFAWHQPDLHRGWMTTAQTVDWVDARNPFGKFLAPPLVVAKRNDGRLTLASYPGWDAYRPEDWLRPLPGSASLFSETPTAADARWHLDSPAAMDILTCAAPGSDMVVEGEIILDAARGGFAPRLNDDGDGLFIELVPESREVALQRWGAVTRDDGRSWRHSFDSLQQVRLHEPIARGTAVPFRLLSVGPYIELSLGGEVAIATATGKPAAGSWGIWAEDGSCALTNARWAPMRQPGQAGAIENRGSDS